MSRRKLSFILTVLTAALFLAACGQGGTDGGQTYSPELIAEGETQYMATCSACHGADARGIENLGKTLVGSQFVADNSDQELLEYVKVGRAVDDPLNTTGIAMPPKGGNPALTDDQITAIIGYIRSIQ